MRSTDRFIDNVLIYFLYLLSIAQRHMASEKRIPPASATPTITVLPLKPIPV
jgi:hypothetical protein